MTTTTSNKPEYHRNGVSGLGFNVVVAEGTLCVTFEEHEDEYRDHTGKWVNVYRDMHLAVNLDNLAELPEQGHMEIPCLSDCDGSAWLVSDPSKGDGTFVALHTPNSVECATAVLCVSLLPSVEFGSNSWRGDNWHADVARWHQEEHIKA